MRRNSIGKVVSLWLRIHRGATTDLGFFPLNETRYVYSPNWTTGIALTDAAPRGSACVSGGVCKSCHTTTKPHLCFIGSRLSGAKYLS